MQSQIVTLVSQSSFNIRFIPNEASSSATANPERETVKDEIYIDKILMLENGIIKLSRSPWTSPIVLVTKTDGISRFCIDYHCLNAIAHKDS